MNKLLNRLFCFGEFLNDVTIFCIQFLNRFIQKIIKDKNIQVDKRKENLSLHALPKLIISSEQS